MHNLCKLFSLLQLTKDQPLSGYLLGGIKLGETSTLAEHHYTAALMGWLVTEEIKQGGGTINERKVVLGLLIHDLSELFGGDISGPINRKYPELRQLKDKIGERAISVLTDYLSPPAARSFKALWHELAQAQTDEAIVVKIIDQMDHQFFLEYHNYQQRHSNDGAGEINNYRPKFVKQHIFELVPKIKNPRTRRVVQEFLDEFKRNFFNRGYQGMQILMEE